MKIRAILALFLLTATTATAEESWSKIYAQYKRAIKDGNNTQRAAALNIVAGHDSKKAAALFIDVMLTDTAVSVAMRARDALGLFKSDEAVKEVEKKAKKVSSSDQRQLFLLEAFTRMKNPAILKLLMKHAKSKDLKVQLLALEGLGNLREPDEKVLKVLYPLVGPKTPFSIRVTAIHSLAMIPAAENIPVLITAMKTAGLTREAAARGLILLTNVNFGLDRKKWDEWWQANGKQFKLDEDEVRKKHIRDISVDPKEKESDFYGIPIYSKRILFVIDKSGSMAMGQSPRRIDGVKTELMRLIHDFSEDIHFNMMFFSHNISYWKGKSLWPADKKIKINAAGYVKIVKPEGATFTDEAMKAAFRFIVEKEQVETVFLLTDGAPFNRDYLPMEPIRQEIAGLNRFVKARIHTIGCFTGAAEQPNRGEPTRADLTNFLKGIAKDNDGMFKELVGN